MSPSLWPSHRPLSPQWDSHHCWLAAPAAGDIGRGDEAPWDGASVEGGAARGGDTICEGRDRERALVRAQAQGFLGDLPSPMSPLVSCSLGPSVGLLLPALPLLMGMELSVCPSSSSGAMAQ